MNTERIYALSSAAREYVLREGAPQYLAELIGELYEMSREDLDAAAARSAGRSNARTAALRLLRYVPKEKQEQYGGAWLDEQGRQCFTNSYMGICLNSPLPLPEVARQKTLERIITEQAKDERTLEIPETLAQLKAMQRRHAAECKNLPRAQKKQKALYCFGENRPWVDLDFLINALEILPDASVSASASLGPAGMVHLNSAAGVGVICPVRAKADAKAVNA